MYWRHYIPIHESKHTQQGIATNTTRQQTQHGNKHKGFEENKSPHDNKREYTIKYIYKK